MLIRASKMDHTLRFDSVVIIESLGPPFRRTGDWLFHNVLTPIAERSEGLGVSYCAVSTASEFVEALDHVLHEYAERGRSPIIHIEAHGDPRGIELSSGAFVPWEATKAQLTSINLACRFHLFVVLALCHGSFLSRTLLPTERAPVWALLGPNDEVPELSLRCAMERFYTELLTSFDGRKALFALNKQLAVPEWEYEFITSEMMFCYAFHHYFDAYCSPEELLRREDAIIRMAQGRGRTPEQAEAMRPTIRAELRNDDFFFEKLKATFFATDIMPENAGRFRLTVEDCRDTHPEGVQPN